MTNRRDPQGGANEDDSKNSGDIAQPHTDNSSGSRALIAGELDPWLADGLSQILYTCASDETQLALDHECASEHGDECTKGNEEMDLQTGNDGNETHEHSD